MTSLLIRADARRIPLADKSVDLVIGSPPYTSARLYLEDGKDLGIARDTQDWIDWMLGVSAEALRVSRGLVLWVCAGRTEDWNYQPACEGLLYRWWAQGGQSHCYRPAYWHRYGIPGSGKGEWYRGDVEYVLAFKRPGRLPYADPLANGHKPVFGTGGPMSNRNKAGKRDNAWGGGRPRTPSGRRPDGSPIVREKSFSISTGNPEAIADPGNIVSTGAGGHLGCDLAHENEAPYPVDVPAHFINSHCPPGGTVLDCFSGSGTTGHAAKELGRNYIGCDLRQSQCLLGRRRLRTVTPGFAFGEPAPEPVVPNPSLAPDRPRDPLPNQSSFLDDIEPASVA